MPAGDSVRPGPPKMPSAILAPSASTSPIPRSLARASVMASPAMGTVRAATARPSTHRQRVVLRCPMSARSRVPSSSKTEVRFASTSPSASTVRGLMPASRIVSKSSATSERGARVAVTSVRAFSWRMISQSTKKSLRSKGTWASTSKGTARPILRRSRKGKDRRRVETRSPARLTTTCSVGRSCIWMKSRSSLARAGEGSSSGSWWSCATSTPRRVCRNSTAFTAWLPRSSPRIRLAMVGCLSPNQRTRQERISGSAGLLRSMTASTVRRTWP